MIKVTLEFNTLAEAEAAIASLRSAAPGPAPIAHAPTVAPVQATLPLAGPPPVLEMKPGPALAVPAAPAPAPMPVAPAPSGGVTKAELSAAVQAYAKAYTPKGCKARFAELGYTDINAIPEADYARVIQYFRVG